MFKILTAIYFISVSGACILIFDVTFGVSGWFVGYPVVIYFFQDFSTLTSIRFFRYMHVPFLVNINENKTKVTLIS